MGLLDGRKASATLTDIGSLRDALLEMSAKQLGMTAVVDAGRHLLGVFTDGDLRRALDRNIDVHNAVIDDVMTGHGQVCHAPMLAAEALRLMQEHRISVLVVVADDDVVEGVLHMQDLLRAGVV